MKNNEKDHFCIVKISIVSFRNNPVWKNVKKITSLQLYIIIY